MNIVFAGGGTAGHLYPAVVVARELRERSRRFEFFFLISRRGKGRGLLSDYGFRFSELPVTGVGSPVIYRVFPAALRMLRAYFRSRRLLREVRAQAVVGFGAYVSVAPVLAARAMGLKIIIHEQNAVMGRANRCLAPLADSIAVGLPLRRGLESGRPYTYTGIPLRPELERPVRKGDAIDFLGLERGKFTLLVMGGSQGAHPVNRVLVQAAAIFSRDSDIQIVHLAGGRDYGEVVKAYAKTKVKASVFPYLKEMEWAYAASDLAVCRCGAMTLAELAQAALPSILIPYPHAVGDHQTANGRIFEEAGAAILKEEIGLREGELVEIVATLKGDPGRMARMSDAARSLASPRAAERLADLIEETVKR